MDDGTLGGPLAHSWLLGHRIPGRGRGVRSSMESLKAIIVAFFGLLMSLTMAPSPDKNADALPMTVGALSWLSILPCLGPTLP